MWQHAYLQICRSREIKAGSSYQEFGLSRVKLLTNNNNKLNVLIRKHIDLGLAGGSSYRDFELSGLNCM